MKLSLKLPLAFIAVLLVALVAGLAGIYSLNRVVVESGQTVQDNFARERAVGYIAVAYKVEVLHWKNLLLRAADPAEQQKQWDAYLAAEKEVDSKARAVLEQLDGDARRTMTRFVELHAQQRERYTAARAMVADGGAAAADASVRGIDVEPANLLAESIGLLTKSSAAITEQAAASGSRTVTITTVLMLLVAVVVVAASLALSRAIIRPLHGALAVAQAITNGDLTGRKPPPRPDEMGQMLTALGEMTASLHRIVTQVRSGTDAIVTASGEIEAGNADLSARTEQQAGVLEETAASIEELTATVRQNADNADQARQLAAGAADVAQRGGEAVAQVVATMAGIQRAGQEMGTIIATIDGIAFQTNILALNAAVEAARAGEQGRGFAVVAGEVRTLAQRSAEAARQIKQLIDASSEQVEQGGVLVDRAGATMTELVGSVNRVSDIIAEISHASQEQRAGIEQVNQAIGDMDQVTQQNAALVEESAAAAGAMREQAVGLAKLVAVFELQRKRY
ncbi:HAMP domain-containing protein [Pseudoduganella sp. FT55W]|uniref:HAMP domain-containing protein n=1 Tax=Duganella rivi TaxID=2666083 RepID=A0A7X4GP59_9BURK|nr:methyl-accepting chemotaxis protein [Duganella rivi]MYM66605.1 HAMP domain-containing protein [Duganella rivi]